MKIWMIDDPRDFQYARATWRGTWSEGKGLCPECTDSKQDRLQPLILEWEAGSDQIGDFTCTGTCDGFALVDSVARELARKLKGFELGPVEMVQNPRLKRSSRPNRQRKPRIWLPYSGPKLHELWVTARVPMDLQRTTAGLVRDCKTCGSKRYELVGYEDRQVAWDSHSMRGIRFRTPRAPGQGLYVQERVLAGADIFRVSEFDGWVLCTDRAVDFIEERGYTNVSFMEMGETI